jgi:DNA-binding transcriptional LysR family regulator
MSSFDPTSPFDLNLIRILLALDRTRSVTRGAELLNMSQSGFSSALARLRRQCDDPLFVRSAAGMVATANGRRYVEVATRALATIEQGMLTPARFDPLSMTSEFRMVMSDIAEIVFLPKAITRTSTPRGSTGNGCTSIRLHASCDAAIHWMPAG